MKIVKWSSRLLFAFCLLFIRNAPKSVNAWEWSDYMGDGSAQLLTSDTLTMNEVSDMRVRDLKRGLIRRHGFGADEVGRMLDKKELIQTLAFEEHKLRQRELEEVKRNLFWKGILTAIVVGAVTLFWPLLKHLYEVASVNFVVYTDLLLMGVLDVLQLWMTISIFLGWFMTSKYFFPMPSLPIRPAALMGGPVSQGPLAKYGLNVAPMAISWVLRFVHGQLEAWVGSALHRAQKRQKRQQRAKDRANETEEERTARKAAKRAAKAAEKAKQNPPEEKEVPIKSLTPEEMRQAALDAAEARREKLESHTALDDLD